MEGDYKSKRSENGTMPVLFSQVELGVNVLSLGLSLLNWKIVGTGGVLKP